MSGFGVCFGGSRGQLLALSMRTERDGAHSFARLKLKMPGALVEAGVRGLLTSRRDAFQIVRYEDVCRSAVTLKLTM